MSDSNGETGDGLEPEWWRALPPVPSEPPAPPASEEHPLPRRQPLPPEIPASGGADTAASASAESDGDVEW